MKKSIFIILLSASVLSGCSSVSKSTLTGIGVGMATGAVAGSSLSDKDRGKRTVQAGLIMGLIGGIAGYYSHKGLEKRDEKVRKETLFNLDKYEVSTPIHGGGGKYDFRSSKDILILTDDPKLLNKLK